MYKEKENLSKKSSILLIVMRHFQFVKCIIMFTSCRNLNKFVEAVPLFCLWPQKSLNVKYLPIRIKVVVDDSMLTTAQLTHKPASNYLGVVASGVVVVLVETQGSTAIACVDVTANNGDMKLTNSVFIVISSLYMILSVKFAIAL